MQLSAAHTSANTGEEMPSGSPWKFNGKKKKKERLQFFSCLFFLYLEESKFLLNRNILSQLFVSQRPFRLEYT